MSFILSFFNDTVKDKASKVELEVIDELKKQLVEVGFAPNEVNFMIKSHMKNRKKSFSELSSSEIQEIKDALSEQLDLAHRCINLIEEK